jgi:hypothetical protein
VLFGSGPIAVVSVRTVQRGDVIVTVTCMPQILGGFQALPLEQFGVDARIGLQTKINWRTRHDSNV